VSSVLFAPHCDDEALFATYLILRHRPRVVVCLYESDERTSESMQAMKELGASLEQWRIPHLRDDRFVLVERMMRQMRDAYEHVFAPCPEYERNGHSYESPSDQVFGVLDHDRIGSLALDIWGPERVTLYKTYARWDGRLRDGVEVRPEPGWIALKLRALAHYTSQHHHEPTASWFVQPDLREWTA
jgi:hypothetical protein